MLHVSCLNQLLCFLVFFPLLIPANAFAVRTGSSNNGMPPPGWAAALPPLPSIPIAPMQGPLLASPRIACPQALGSSSSCAFSPYHRANEMESEDSEWLLLDPTSSPTGSYASSSSSVPPSIGDGEEEEEDSSGSASPSSPAGSYASSSFSVSHSIGDGEEEEEDSSGSALPSSPAGSYASSSFSVSSSIGDMEEEEEDSNGEDRAAVSPVSFLSSDSGKREAAELESGVHSSSSSSSNTSFAQASVTQNLASHSSVRLIGAIHALLGLVTQWMQNPSSVDFTMPLLRNMVAAFEEQLVAFIQMYLGYAITRTDAVSQLPLWVGLQLPLQLGLQLQSKLVYCVARRVEDLLLGKLSVFDACLPTVVASAQALAHLQTKLNVDFALYMQSIPLGTHLGEDDGAIPSPSFASYAAFLRFFAPILKSGVEMPPQLDIEPLEQDSQEIFHLFNRMLYALWLLESIGSEF